MNSTLTNIHTTLYLCPSYRPAVLGVTIVMVLMMASLHWAGLGEALAFQRESITQGQWWRLYTGHFTHFTTYHLVMNCAGVMVISYLFLWRLSLAALLLHWILVPLMVGLFLYFFSSGLDEYRGFSGVFYSLLMTGLIISRHADALLAWGGMLLLVGKTAYEQLPIFDDQYLLEQIGAAVAADAHLYGILAALLMSFGLWAGQRLQCRYRHGE